MKTLLVTATTLLILATSVQAETPSMEMNDIISGAHRSENNIARNEFRHPQETLSFFGIKADMTVVELWPGGGWYTEILAPYLADEGQLIAAHFDADAGGDYYKKSRQGFDQKMAENPIYNKVKTIDFNPGVSDLTAYHGQADAVLTFRSLHNWMRADKLDAVLKDVFAMLKSGGVFAVVEHRADAKAEIDPQAKKGYVNQGYAIQLIEAAGFKLVAISEVNANPKDSANHANGVWTLPPTLRVPEGADKASYQAIGESDRFTLKFIKPE
ncbi:MAG: methyltransferase [Proteobacteria bacterium]|nr:MAG: methyltransferase [Pseudomonadota bacterium]